MRASLLIAALLVPVAASAEETPPDAPVYASVRDRPYAPFVTNRIGSYTPIAGSVDEFTTASNYANGPTMFFLGAGMRVNDIVVSLMFGIGGSGTHDAADAPISAAGASPGGNAITGLLGIEGEYRLRHVSRRWVPFVGGLLGYNVMGTSGDFNDRQSVSTNYGGLHVRAMAGVDLVTSQWFGIGLVAELAVTRFGSATMTMRIDDDPLTFENEAYSESIDLPDPGGTSVWAGLSLRAVLFP